MPNYRNRDEMIADENDATGGAMEVLNMYGANEIVPKKETGEKVKNPIIDEYVEDIMNSKKPHRQMVRSILKMKPKDIHIIKKSAKYFLDNPHELKDDIQDGMLEDLSETTGSNDLADMIDQDYEDTNGGDLDGSGDDSLLVGLAHLLDHIPTIQKTIS